MQPNVTPMRLARWALVALALVAAVVFALSSLGKSDGTVGGAEENLAAAELEQQAASARAATKPALTHAESLHVRVRVERPGMLRVQGGGPADTTLVPVPPLVTDRIQADSVAISMLSVALTSDSGAVAAEVRARDAASVTIAALERERRPRCGWRCGLLLGAASVVALGIAVR
ncbi:MAG: hypothetical protein ACJ796_17185 [Gemmatimonadaceae bacterium]